MKRILSSVCFLLVSIAAFQGCTFAPDKNYVNPITPPPTTISGDVKVTSPVFTDTYELDSPTDFTLVIENVTHPVTGAEVRVDGSPIIATIDHSKVLFSVDPANYGTGDHDVVVSVYVSTESGSIADKMGTERYTLKNTFTFTVPQ